MQSKPRNSRAERAERLDRKLGMLWSRLWSVVVGIAGAALIAWYFTAPTERSVEGTAFIVGIGALLLFAARHLWRSKDSLTELIDDVEKPTRRSE